MLEAEYLSFSRFCFITTDLFLFFFVFLLSLILGFVLRLLFTFLCWSFFIVVLFFLPLNTIDFLDLSLCEVSKSAESVHLTPVCGRLFA